MDLERLSDDELLQSLIAETAKAFSEVRTIQGDLDKINSRLRFALVVINILKEREINK
jgi:hypothetical protein